MAGSCVVTHEPQGLCHKFSLVVGLKLRQDAFKIFRHDPSLDVLFRCLEKNPKILPNGSKRWFDGDESHR